MAVRPRRSVLYMPGSNARAIEKARTLAADALILDLEDAVAPDAPWGGEDLAAAAAATPDAILLPKVSTPEDLAAIGARLDALGAPAKIRTWAMMETPLAILNAREIAAAAGEPATRLSGLVMGTNDLAKDTRAKILPGRAPMLAWLTTCVAAARAYGLDIVDGVFNDIADAQGFARECAEARELGFDGKTLIHPSQIEPCNAAFSPTEDEVASARKIIAAFDLPENRDKGVVRIDGRMVERLHADMARRTVAIADAIAQSVSA